MNALAAKVLEAADLRALARLADDGAPGSVTRHRPATAQAVTRYAWPAPSR